MVQHLAVYRRGLSLSSRGAMRRGTCCCAQTGEPSQTSPAGNSAVPKRSENSGVLTPDAGTSLGWRLQPLRSCLCRARVWSGRAWRSQAFSLRFKVWLLRVPHARFLSVGLLPLRVADTGLSAVAGVSPSAFAWHRLARRGGLQPVRFPFVRAGFPDAGTRLGRKSFSLSFRGAMRRACLPQAGNLLFLLKETAFA